MGRVNWIEHKGKKILYIDFSGLNEEEFIKTIGEAKRIMEELPDGYELLDMADITGTPLKKRTTGAIRGMAKTREGLKGGAAFCATISETTFRNKLESNTIKAQEEKMSHKEQQSIKQQQQSTQTDLNGQLKVVVPDPEVVVTASRRRFSQSYKKRVLAEADQCTTDGEVGALLRREGLYSSHLSRWRQAREQGKLAGDAQAKRGRKADPQAVEIARLTKANERLKQELEQAQLVVDIQKKVSQLLGLQQTMEAEPK